MLVFERGASSRLVAGLKPGEPVLLMGPTGVRARIGSGDTLLLIGGRQAVATTLAIGPALRAAGSRVLFFAMFKEAADVFLREEIESATDCVVWCTAKGASVKPNRAGDLAAQGEIGDILTRYARGELGAATIPLPQVNRLQVVGEPSLVQRIRELRRGELGKHLTGLTESTCAVHGMMQCMLKGVCSQCLQWQIDPATGNRTKAVFACSWQDEPMDIVDLDNVNERQSQNRLQEYLTGLWLDHLKVS
jgi:NAD(P)H-flavin reductase